MAATANTHRFNHQSALNADPTRPTPVHIGINYRTESEQIAQFLQKFEAPQALPNAISGKEEEDSNLAKSGYEQEAVPMIRKYFEQMQEIANMKRTSIVIELDDLLAFDDFGQELVEHIMKNAYRYVELFSREIDRLMPAPSNTMDLAQMDVINVLVSHRRARLRAKNIPEEEVEKMFPRTLLRRYLLDFKTPSKEKMLAVRQVKADQVGALIKLKGIVTRVSEVKPLLIVGTYTCEQCGYEVYQEITTQAFMPVTTCPTDECVRNNTRGQLVLQSRGSRFQKFQEARVQELTDQVPMGHIPRAMTVHLHGGLTRTINPGDHVIISGIFLPRPYTGFKAIKAGLLTDTYLYATNVHQIKQRYDQIEMSDAIKQQLNHLATDPDIVTKLARSIAPEIYGHIDVKKALLLLMVGGISREMSDGMKIRGDINVCLMGDPGVAKSQLLKYIASIAPRGVYTTGKGSSGVGLTAAVTRDSVTNEMVLEGGALVLADNGICCIDEFDKMDELDRTAIHEVMEQQTISISKAGITTTLNARASILAAANPLHGRYNPKKSPRENINLPPALLSRFDIMFLILDTPDLETDTRLAEHVCQVHRTNCAPISRDAEVVLPEILRLYIAQARRFTPFVPRALSDYIVGAYVSLRMNDLHSKDASYTTARTLLAVLRLSQALAKIRFSSEVSKSDVDEAMRILEVARSSVDKHLQKGTANHFGNDPTTAIYGLIRELANAQVRHVSSTATATSPSSSSTIEAQSSYKELSMELIRDRVRARGFTDEQLQKCLVEFDQYNIWTVSATGTALRIFN